MRVRLRAERRLGELIEAQQQVGLLASRGQSKENSSTLRLSDVGIPHNRSAMAQTLARVPEGFSLSHLSMTECRAAPPVGQWLRHSPSSLRNHGAMRQPHIPIGVDFRDLHLSIEPGTERLLFLPAPLGEVALRNGLDPEVVLADESSRASSPRLGTTPTSRLAVIPIRRSRRFSIGSPRIDRA